MLRPLYSLYLFPQILLITVIICHSISNPSGNAMKDFNMEVGSPMSIRCYISDQEQYENSTYNLSSEDSFIKFSGNFLGNITITGNQTAMFSEQNVAINDEGFYKDKSKSRTERMRRSSRDTIERELSTYFIEVKPTSMVLRWHPPPEVIYLCKPHPPIKYDVQYHPVYETNFKVARPRSYTDSVQLLNLIPNTRYHFKFRCKPRSEKNDSVWMFTETSYMTTLPDVPYWRPEITNSSFSSEIENFEDAERSIDQLHSVHNRTITLYWKNIPAEYENGEKFQYWIRVSAPFRSYIKKEVSAARQTSHSFTGMLPSVSYRFEIFAGNIVGNSTNSSVIVVGEERSLLNGPNRIIFFSHTYDYEIILFPGRHKVKYYTVFWCKSSQPRPVRCEDSLQWSNMPWKGLSYYLHPPHKSIDYQFAVSANSETRTSGMIWAHCHISDNKRSIIDDLWAICYSFIDSLRVGPARIWRQTVGILYL